MHFVNTQSHIITDNILDIYTRCVYKDDNGCTNTFYVAEEFPEEPILLSEDVVCPVGNLPWIIAVVIVGVILLFGLLLLVLIKLILLAMVSNHQSLQCLLAYNHRNAQNIESLLKNWNTPILGM